MRRGVEPALGQGHVSRRRHELAKLRVRHLVAIDPEAIDAHGVGEALLRTMALGAHHERSTADERHPSVVVVLRRQAGIGGAASEFAPSRVLLRDGGGERAGHQTGGADADGADQQAAQYHASVSAIVGWPRSITDMPISSGAWTHFNARCILPFADARPGVRHTSYRLLTFTVLDHLLDLLLHRIKVEGSWILHRRIVDRRQRQFLDILLDHDEAPELTGEEVVHVATALVVEAFTA